MNLSLALEFVGDVTIPTQVIKYNQFLSRRISQPDCTIHIKLNYLKLNVSFVLIFIENLIMQTWIIYLIKQLYYIDNMLKIKCFACYNFQLEIIMQKTYCSFFYHIEKKHRYLIYCTRIFSGITFTRYTQSKLCESQII